MKKSITMVFFFLFVLGCEKQSITDLITPESPITIEMNQDLITVENHNDGMARRNLEYISKDKGKIAVDPKYFNQNGINRGDVIYYKTPTIDKNKYPQLNPSENNIARVIALPGEEIEIKKGKVYINGKRLDTFYGKALSWGLEEEEYFKTVNKPGSAQCDECQRTMKEYFNMEMDKVKVPKGHLFVMGDTWWRSIDSQIYGSLPVANIKGRVLGYASSGLSESTIDKEYIKKHAKIGLTELEITETFGNIYLKGNVDNSDVWLFDKTKEGFEYKKDINRVAHEAIKNNDVEYQLFIIVKNNKTMMFSYFYKGDNEQVWEYVVNPDGTILEAQVSH